MARPLLLDGFSTSLRITWALDVQLKEARQAKEQLDEYLALFAESLQALAPLEALPAWMVFKIPSCVRT